MPDSRKATDGVQRPAEGQGEPKATPKPLAGRFAKLPVEVLARCDLTLADKLVFAHLADRMRGRGLAWPGLRRIGKACGIAPTTVARAVFRLEAAGLLAVERVSGNPSHVTNRYRLGEPYQNGALAERSARKTERGALAKRSAERSQNETNTEPCIQNHPPEGGGGDEHAKLREADAPPTAPSKATGLDSERCGWRGGLIIQELSDSDRLAEHAAVDGSREPKDDRAAKKGRGGKRCSDQEGGPDGDGIPLSESPASAEADSARIRPADDPDRLANRAALTKAGVSAEMADQIASGRETTTAVVALILKRAERERWGPGLIVLQFNDPERFKSHRDEIRNTEAAKAMRGRESAERLRQHAEDERQFKAAKAERRQFGEVFATLGPADQAAIVKEADVIGGFSRSGLYDRLNWRAAPFSGKCRSVADACVEVMKARGIDPAQSPADA